MSKKKNNKNKDNSLIPAQEKKDGFDEEKNKRIVFVFKDYLHKDCWLCNINKKSKVKNLIDKLSNISKIKISEIGDYKSIIKTVVPCKKNNEYKTLFCKENFKQYESDFYEIIWSDTNRVFWYFINNIFHIILIKDRHLKDDKK